MKNFVGSAGHSDGFFVTENENLLKKWQCDSQAELDFLNNLKISNDPIYQYAPKIFGVREVDGTKFLEMENLLQDVIEPSVMDLKVSY